MRKGGRSIFLPVLRVVFAAVALFVFAPGALGESVEADRQTSAGRVPAQPDESALVTTIPSGCLPTAFPTTPRGPSASFIDRTSGTSSFDATVWHEPCAGNPTRSVVMMRITPVGSVGAWVCDISWKASQGGRRFTLPWMWNSRSVRSVCERFTAPVTVAFDFDSPSGFDPDASFTLSHSWLALTPAAIPIPAYVPNLTARTLTVNLTGSGAGQVNSSPSGIVCISGSCSSNFYEGTSVTLTAAAWGTSTFAGWGGACSGSATTARLTMVGNATCTAHFTPPPVMPESGWWWSAAEPGRGYSLELKNGRLFIASYAYRADGSASWYLSQGSWDGYGLTTTLVEYEGGQAIGGTWKKAIERGSVGTVTLSFSTATRGSITWGNGTVTAIERFAFAGDPAGIADRPPDPATIGTDDETVRLQRLRDLATSQGVQRVIVRLHGSSVPAADGQRMQAALGRSGSQVRSTFRSLPLLVADVTPAGLDVLLADPSVAAVHEDARREMFLSTTVPKIRAPEIRSQGYSGKGRTVAVIDTGVARSHAFFGGRVVSEACFSTSMPLAGIVSACPNRADVMIGTDSGAPCSNDAAGCYHGTHVAGIVAGRGSTSTGVAPDAGLMSIQVFRHYPAARCANLRPCIAATDSDLLRALEHVRENASRLNVASINLSLGGGSYSSYCDGEPYKPVIDQLRTMGVATIIATGNDGDGNLVAAPACVSSAIRVGATTNADALASFSNEWRLPMLLAPGNPVVSSVPGGGFRSLSGTSMATPHVAGAWAVLKGSASSAGVEAILAAITTTGTAVVSARSRRSYPRLDMAAAYEALTQIETGWWWSAAEPGSGYFVEAKRGFLFLSVYTYGADGRAAWYIASGTYAGGLFQGTLQEYGGGQAIGDIWRPAEVVGDRGTVTLRWVAPGTALLALPDGRQLTLARFSF